MSPPAKFDEDEYEDRAQSILISRNDGTNIVYDTKYRERMEKSDTGLPIARYTKRNFFIMLIKPLLFVVCYSYFLMKF